jgi:Spy/CpxP family protein refolding chaperone
MKSIFRKGLILFSIAIMMNIRAEAQNRNTNNSRIQNGQFALESRNEEIRLGKRIEMLTKRLSLTTEQIERVKTIERNNMDQERRLRERNSTENEMSGISRNQKKSVSPNSMEQSNLRYEYYNLRKESNDKIEELLTRKQKSKFSKLREKEEKLIQEKVGRTSSGFQDGKIQSQKSFGGMRQSGPLRKGSLK